MFDRRQSPNPASIENTFDDMHVSSNAGSRMRHVLDNPVCNALIGPHADVALSHSRARHRLLDAQVPPVLVREPTVVPA